MLGQGALQQQLVAAQAVPKAALQPRHCRRLGLLLLVVVVAPLHPQVQLVLGALTVCRGLGHCRALWRTLWQHG